MGRVLAQHGVALWRVDPYGVGNSDGEFASTTYDSELDDYGLVISESGARFLVGHSVGCGMALRLAKAGDIVWCLAPSFGRTPPSLIPDELRAEMTRERRAERKATMLRADFLARIEEPVKVAAGVSVVMFRGTDEEHYPRDVVAQAVPSARIIDVEKGDHNFLGRGGRDALWRAMDRELSPL
jgi:pimeloyl-ACP methyl ester carboxylesterase